VRAGVVRKKRRRTANFGACGGTFYNGNTARFAEAKSCGAAFLEKNKEMLCGIKNIK
jgi:hypothetical protein